MILFDIVQSPLGYIHLIASILSLVLGTMVLAWPKGTLGHKRMGYGYVLCMVVVCGSALGLYHLTGRFGMFHVAAIVGFLTLLAGIVPMWIKRLSRQARAVHFWFMYYSILGLYAAFASELIVRIPDQPFYPMVGLATAMVFGTGTFVILRKEKIWSRYFD